MEKDPEVKEEPEVYDNSSYWFPAFASGEPTYVQVSQERG